MSTSLDGVLIKKANKTETFTDAQLEDLAKCIDPVSGYLKGKFGVDKAESLVNDFLFEYG